MYQQEKFYGKLKRFSLFYDYYAIAMDQKHKAETFFDECDIPVNCIADAGTDAAEYTIAIYRVRKSYRLNFIMAVQRFPRWMTEHGFSNYLYKAYDLWKDPMITSIVHCV